MKEKLISVFSSIGALIWACFGGSCGIACFAGGCCGGTALLGFLSLSGSTLAFLNRLTPVFLGLTVLSLAYAFYKAYKPKPAVCCTSDNQPDSSVCCTPEKKQSFFKSKTFLWITTLLCAIMWTYALAYNNNDKVINKKTSACCPANVVTDTTRADTVPCCNQ